MTNTYSLNQPYPQKPTFLSNFCVKSLEFHRLVIKCYNRLNNSDRAWIESDAYSAFGELLIDCNSLHSTNGENWKKYKDLYNRFSYGLGHPLCPLKPKPFKLHNLK